MSDGNILHLQVDKCSPALPFDAYFSKRENDYTSAEIIKVSRDENVISEGVNVWHYPSLSKGFHLHRGNRSASKTESKYWHFQGKTLIVVQVFDLCLTCLLSMWDVPCVLVLWFLSYAIVASSTTITVLEPLHSLRFQNQSILRTNILYFCSCQLFWILFTQNTFLHKKHKTPHSRMEESMCFFKQTNSVASKLL